MNVGVSLNSCIFTYTDKLSADDPMVVVKVGTCHTHLEGSGYDCVEWFTFEGWIFEIATNTPIRTTRNSLGGWDLRELHTLSRTGCIPTAHTVSEIEGDWDL
jgi:hypothetical protein